MGTSVTIRIAIAAVVIIGLGAITVVGVNIGRVHYWGTSEDGTEKIFRSEGGYVGKACSSDQGITWTQPEMIKQLKSS